MEKYNPLRIGKVKMDKHISLEELRDFALTLTEPIDINSGSSWLAAQYVKSKFRSKNVNAFYGKVETDDNSYYLPNEFSQWCKSIVTNWEHKKGTTLLCASKIASVIQGLINNRDDIQYKSEKTEF